MNITKISIILMIVFVFLNCQNMRLDKKIDNIVLPKEPVIYIFEPPVVTECPIEAIYAIDGDVGFFAGYHPRLWSFSVSTGEVLDAVGLDLYHTHSFPYIFPHHRLAIPILYDIYSQAASGISEPLDLPMFSHHRSPISGYKNLNQQNSQYLQWGILVADVSDPSNMTELGIIPFPNEILQAENIEIDDDGKTGYIAGFRQDKLYSIDVETLRIVDEVSLPGSPDQIKKSGTKVLVKTFPGGDIIVVDVSSPENLRIEGVIDIPGGGFYSNQNIVMAADKKNGFVCKDDKIWSFDIENFTMCDEDGLYIGATANTLSINGDIVGCCIPSYPPTEKALAFIDVSDPKNMKVKCYGDFGSPVEIIGAGRVDFSSDGKLAAVSTCNPEGAVYIFKTLSGELVESVSTPGSISHLDVFGPDDIIGVVKISDYASGLDCRVFLLHNYLINDGG